MKSFRDYGIDLPDVFQGDRKVKCPQCSHTRKKPNDPCLSVNGQTGTWNCHNCGWKGHRDDRLDFERQPMRKTYSRPAPLPPEEACKISANILAWFKTRGISKQTLTRAKIFSTRRYFGGRGRDAECMAFPFYRDGELINIKYRDGKKNITQEKDPEPCLWNYDACKDAKTIYITEGEIDTLTCMEAQRLTAVSVDKGAPNAKDADASKKLECVTNAKELLDNAETVVLVTDKDEPGLRLEKELIEIIGAAKCKLVSYPEGCKDINDVLVKCGLKAVVDVLEKAQPAPVPGLRSFSEFKTDLDGYYRKGKPKGLTTGFPELDENFTLQPGSVNIFTGVPQSGKTEFVHHLSVNAWRLHGWKAFIYSPEMFPVENIACNFAEKLMGKPFFGSGETRLTWEEKETAFKEIDDFLKPYVPDEDKTPSLEDLLLAAKVAIARFGVKVIIIDPYNELEHTRPPHLTETEYISAFMSRLRKFARQTKTWVALVAHPTKLKKDPKSGKYPVATLYDIAGSANFFNKTDNGLSLYREAKKNCNRVQVHIQKVKSKHIGRAGTQVDLEWERSTGRFSEIKPAEEAPDLPETPRDITEGRRYSDEDDPQKLF